MYKNKKIAIIFFAINSKRFKNKLFKKIVVNSILSHSIKLSKKINFIDERIMATTNKRRDDKIASLAKKKNKNFRGSENNVLEKCFLPVNL